jgi:hypothetical protein
MKWMCGFGLDFGQSSDDETKRRGNPKATTRINVFVHHSLVSGLGGVSYVLFCCTVNRNTMEFFPAASMPGRKVRESPNAQSQEHYFPSSQ